MSIGELKPVYFFYGAEDYLITQCVAKIKAQALSSGPEAFNFHQFYATSISIEDVIAEAMTLPAMSPMRVVIVKGAEALKAAQLKQLLPYVKDPSPTTALIFISGATKVERSSAFFKVLSDRGFLMRKGALRDSELASRIKQESRKAGKDITRPAALKLIEIAGNGLREVLGELEKTILFAGDAPVIEQDHVESAGADIKEESLFALADAIGEKDAHGALKVYAKLSTEPPLKLLGAISRQFRILLKVKVLLDNRTAKAKVASLAGIFSSYVDKYIRSSKAFTHAELTGAFKLLSNADKELKGLKGTGFTPNLVMTTLIMNLCG